METASRLSTDSSSPHPQAVLPYKCDRRKYFKEVQSFCVGLFVPGVFCWHNILSVHYCCSTCQMSFLFRVNDDQFCAFTTFCSPFHVLVDTGSFCHLAMVKSTAVSVGYCSSPHSQFFWVLFILVSLTPTEVTDMNTKINIRCIWRTYE